MNSGDVWSSNFYNLGQASFEAGSYAHAVMMFSQSVKANQNNWQARFYLAQSCHAARMYEEASINFRHIIRVCPDEELRQQASVALNSIESTSLVRWLLHPLQSTKLSATA